MRKRLLYASGTLLLVLLVSLIVWQGSFDFGRFGPSSMEQTFMLWAVSTLIFILTITLGFMLVRNFVKLYVERHSNREGSRIRTKLVMGALALTTTPVIFLVIFSVSVLNRNIDKWFSRPATEIRLNLIEIGTTIDRETEQKAIALIDWISTLPETEAARQNDRSTQGSLDTICKARGILEIVVQPVGAGPIRLCSASLPAENAGQVLRGNLLLRYAIPVNLARTKADIDDAVRRYDKLALDKRATWIAYVLLLILITLFILFFATWLALFLAKQISVPIAALLGAAQEVRTGNLSYRVRVNAIDELASLVHAFNEMTMGLEVNSRELENRRKFTEAILESIPTGVVSLTADGRIQRVNRALKGLLSAEHVDRATTLTDLLPSAEDSAEILYLMNRARRLGVAASQLEVRTGGRVLPLSVTVSSLDAAANSGFVVVFEDTSDMLRAQKAAAWHEIARRIAHEMKNPLTPIALCAERIQRQLQRPTPETQAILEECSQIMLNEVETVRALVDEFAQYARFPAAQPTRGDLNEVVENALSAFAGRLESIDVVKDLAPDLPPVNIDGEQFKRLVVNLIDNAAEAMRNSMVRRLYLGTAAVTVDSVELTVADTGCGVTPEDREKLFLPYFSTKGRGTGLGLAIVNQIASEHGAQIRVENNVPVGARFIVELAALPSLVNELTMSEVPV